jgi:cytochrome c peroxidase
MQITKIFAPVAASSLLAFAGCSVAPGPAAPSTTSTSVVTTTTVANVQSYTDASGAVATYTTAGTVDLTSHFFQPLGTNSRTCASCHQLNQGMSISATATLALFNSTSGADPLFNAIDGANCPTASAGDSNARSMLLTKGLIRIPVTLPAAAQFTLTVTHDPYGCAISTSATGQQIVSVYRRPLPASSLPYLSAVMWDTRETISPLTSAATLSTNLQTDLTQQMIDAVANHQQGTTAPSAAAITETLAFMQGLYTAQATDNAAGSLSSGGATGGPADLAAVTYYPGINDAFGGDPTGAAFNPNVFNLYNSWRASTNAQQASINRGQGVFNTAPMQITNVRGINDNPALGGPANLRGSCSTCHDTPNVGSHSLPLALDTGTARLGLTETDPNIIAGLDQLSAPDLPVYQIAGCKSAAGTPVTFTTTDPGKGLFTGLCADVNRTKVPSLRGLAARAPYFHGGSADNLSQLVKFYNARFQMNLSNAQQTDLINFLNAL